MDPERATATRDTPWGVAPQIPESGLAMPLPVGTLLVERRFVIAAAPDAGRGAGGRPPAPAERGEVVCDHRIPAVLRTSRSEKNPGRTYWTCSRRRGRTCGFFRWGDAPGFPQHVAPPPRPEKDPSAITDAERFAAWECEQGSELWLATRRGRLTATGFGPAAGLSEYGTPTEHLRSALWGGAESTNEAMQWGKDHEDEALRRYVELSGMVPAGATVSTHGIWVSAAMPCVGVSPDAVVTVPSTGERWLVEIKCPFKFRHAVPGGEDPDTDRWPEHELPNGWRGRVPPTYLAQMFAQMLQLGCTMCHFVVWTPRELRVTEVPLDPLFCATQLYPLALGWYRDVLVPAMRLRDSGRLRVGFVPDEEP